MQDTTGLMDNIEMYLFGLSNNVDDRLTRANIEQHLVEVATYDNVKNARACAIRNLPFDPGNWHPQAMSLVQFIEYQILAKSGE